MPEQLSEDDFTERFTDKIRDYHWLQPGTSRWFCTFITVPMSRF